MRSVLRKRTVMLGVVLVLVAASLVGGYALAGSAPATTRQPAPIWLGTLGTTTSGRALLVGGGIDVKADLGGAVVKLYKREVGQNTNTYVGKATVSYSRITGNQFYVRRAAAQAQHHHHGRLGRQQQVLRLAHLGVRRREAEGHSDRHHGHSGAHKTAYRH